MSVFVRARSGGAGQLIIRGLSATIPDDADAGVFVTRLSVPIVPDGHWSIESNTRFAVDESTGVVTTLIADIAVGNYNPQVMYSAAIGPLEIVLTASLSIVVQAASSPDPVQIDGPDPEDRIINAPYSQSWAISGGDAPFGWSIVAGELPAWAQVSIDGRTLTIERTPV